MRSVMMRYRITVPILAAAALIIAAIACDAPTGPAAAPPTPTLIPFGEPATQEVSPTATEETVEESAEPDATEEEPTPAAVAAPVSGTAMLVYLVPDTKTATGFLWGAN